MKLPQTRYQGSKRKIIDKIYNIMCENKLISKDTCILDVFGGSGICSTFFQTKNMKVIYNDILQSNCYNAYGILNNNIINIPTENEIEEIFYGICQNTFISNKFKDIYFTEDENRLLDVFRMNIQKYNGIKQKVFYYLLFQSLLSKRPYNLFHRKNLCMRTNDVKRSFGNKITWEKSFIDLMKRFRKELIDFVLQKTNIKYDIINYSYSNIPIDILKSVDIIYIDPPYFKTNKSNSDYIKYYHFLEGFIMTDDNWSKMIDENSKNKSFINIDKYTVENPIQMFENITNKFYPTKIVLSYKEDGFPSIEQICEILRKKYMNISVSVIEYQYALSKTKTKEVIIIAI